MQFDFSSGFRAAAFGTSALCLLASSAAADQVILDDLIVDGSACIGIDCVNGESFGFDTLRLKENNLRIKFDDTSATASFPSNDWQLTANDSGNGGANHFSIDDITGGKTPFRVVAGAPTNALWVNASGNVGVGVANAVVEVHVADGDTPTVRLEQNGSSGFTPQTWDLAGNETNFFVRDVTNGSKLSFKIRPNSPENSLILEPSNILFNDGSANVDIRFESDNDTNALFIEGDDGDVGLGTGIPAFDLHLYSNEASDAVQIQLESDQGQAVQLRMDTTSGNNRRLVGLNGGTVSSQINMGNDRITLFGASLADPWMVVSDDGVVSASGVQINGNDLTVPDYVFEDDYELLSLSQVQTFIDDNGHLPHVPSAAYINANGLNMHDMQLTLLRKVEELTLYTLAQQEEIDSLRKTMGISTE